ncbi:prolipoprotein diacylglyceryl transferase [Aurantimicrobium minutum]|uniref:Phosphatidylglycerol--prolipoprotein diacylglyceryl transferase n=1 Tax=Aurantimicrobium photophilum TaxID=1987356 RepID=A0A2Z3RX83_9MICO|nr:Prolipoprotein diacylglyceryl transferase [Aurantimicrobium photophilum]MBU6264627.1 prolipoprotein diacylglyceryl transferase [Actinomycetales bacterium]MDH6207760.1 prolipoprotein diacylglyceryl transferase [Aurantimicrobium minutum]MDH6255507.1 prolipoprotein diacylglyceryl transferase [Aurantimicrobium minutum]MDH6409168.1 prolipoprotein diacylglyceryl transferase [Aurantimicrobium minutum]
MHLITSIPSPSIQYFDLGPLRIHIYALCILLGIGLATWITDARLSKRGAERGVVLDIILWAVPLGIIGARFYHVFTHPADYFYEGADLMKVFYIWEGGNAIFGSLLGGAVGAWIGCKQTGIRFWSFADALAPAMLIAQATGRLGNYFNHELFGQPTTLPWGLEIESTNPAFPAGLPEGTLFHPMFLYEILWNLLGAFVIIVLERKLYLRWGKAFGVYLIWYGIGRSVFETYRLDSSETFFSIRTNVWAALLAIVVGVLIILIQNRRHPGKELSVYVEGGPTVKLDK